MKLSQPAKVIVAIALGIGAVIGAVKSLAEVMRSLNGWHVLLALSLFLLLCLAMDSFKQWIDGRFASLQDSIETDRREVSRGMSALSTQCDQRIGNISDEFDRKLKKEVDSRVGGEQTDRARLNEIDERLKQIENWFTKFRDSATFRAAYGTKD